MNLKVINKFKRVDEDQEEDDEEKQIEEAIKNSLET